MAIAQIPVLAAIHVVIPTASQYAASLILTKHYHVGIHAASMLYEVTLYCYMWSVVILYVCIHYTYSRNTAAWSKNIR